MDLWLWRLQSSAEDGRLAAHLSDDERRRAGRFATPLLASRFVRARAGLRNVLALYVDRSPDRLEFHYGPHGKPSLGGLAEPAPFFNLSHSENIAALGVCWSAELGVDIERIRPIEATVASFFAAGERRALAKLSGADAVCGFYHLWTCKEALLKALGSGLAVPLDRFEIEIAPDGSPKLHRADRDFGETQQWQLRRFEPELGYAGALAMRSTHTSSLSMRLMDFDVDACVSSRTAYRRV